MIGRCAGDDAVKVVRVPLGRHHPLTPATRAADEIGVCLSATVEVPDDRPCRLGRQMHRPVPKIDFPFMVVKCPAGLDRVSRVPGVGAHRRVSTLERARSRAVAQRRILDGADIATASPHHEPAIPLFWQQQLEVDLGVDAPVNPAVCRTIILRRHGYGAHDVEVNQFHRRQPDAPIAGDLPSPGASGQSERQNARQNLSPCRRL